MAIEFKIMFLRQMTIFLSLAQTWLIGYMLADMKCAPGQAERFLGIQHQVSVSTERLYQSTNGALHDGKDIKKQ